MTESYSRNSANSASSPSEPSQDPQWLPREMVIDKGEREEFLGPHRGGKGGHRRRRGTRWGRKAGGLREPLVPQAQMAGSNEGCSKWLQHPWLVGGRGSPPEPIQGPRLSLRPPPWEVPSYRITKIGVPTPQHRLASAASCNKQPKFTVPPISSSTNWRHHPEPPCGALKRCPSRRYLVLD